MSMSFDMFIKVNLLKKKKTKDRHFHDQHETT